MHETATPPALSAGTRLGERVRSLRASAGLTQTELAGERFSKEYISQIERGKTRPTEATIAWLAEQLGVDPVFLSSGVSTDERAKVEAQLERAEALSAAHSYEESIEAFRAAAPAAEETGSPGSAGEVTHGRGVGAARAGPCARGDRASAARTGPRRAARVL